MTRSAVIDSIPSMSGASDNGDGLLPFASRPTGRSGRPVTAARKFWSCPTIVPISDKGASTTRVALDSLMLWYAKPAAPVLWRDLRAWPHVIDVGAIGGSIEAACGTGVEAAGHFLIWPRDVVVGYYQPGSTSIAELIPVTAEEPPHPVTTIESLDAMIRQALLEHAGVMTAAFRREDVDSDVTEIYLVADEHTDEVYEVLVDLQARASKEESRLRLMFHVRAHQGRNPESCVPTDSVRL